LFTRPAWGEQPHDHRENAPLPNLRPISVTLSTTVGVSTGMQLVWSPIPSSVVSSSVTLFWKAPPFA
jgi:hypothetical protein